MNRLSVEKAAYLRHSASQRIDWYPWCEEAFEKARAEDKPVFLSSGAIWCHWCHVMAKECFEDDEVVKLLNEHCINIKLDRDERPDIDRVYQQAVAAMGAGGGWPLSVFLTPEKKPFFGGTYFPPEDSMGRPGFRKIILAVVEFYREKKDDIAEYVERLMEFVNSRRSSTDAISREAIEEGVRTVLAEFDPQHGGFGSSPKFPMPGAVEMLNGRYFITRDEEVGLVIRKTLGSMAKGGFHDQLGGGFHRYSVDEAWIVPHFEKMADDNAWLLRNYVDGYCLFGEGLFKDAAEGIVRFARDVLSDREGGFYASQDADVTADDEGGYFTWTEDDFKRVLGGEEREVLSLHFFSEQGSMHHDKAKKVLCVAMEPEEIGREVGIETRRVVEIIARGKEKLLAERSKRETPLVDRSLYTSLNGLFISAYLKAHRALRSEYLKEFALKSLRRIMSLRFLHGDLLLHTEGVSALLDDYIMLIDAHVAAYEVTGDGEYAAQAELLMERCIARFWDSDSGGFFETENEIVGVRLKGIGDIPHPAPNAVAIVNLMKLHYLTGKDSYLRHAEKALASFSTGARDMGIHAGYYVRALDLFFHMMKLGLEAPPASPLAHAALDVFNPFTVITYGRNRGYALPCRRGSCYEALYSPEGLREFLAETARSWLS